MTPPLLPAGALIGHRCGTSDTHDGIFPCAHIVPKPKTPQTAKKRHSAGFKRVSPARLERATYGFEVRRSIHLSYGPPDATLATGTR